MKEYDREGLCFYTYYNSAKGMQIDRNPHASMLFYWPHYLEDKKVELEKLVAEKGEEAITRPEDWGGYRLRPHYFEFWQGQTDRIHDRIVFEKGVDETEWLIKRLSP
ncbi:hypothetical protein LOAG_18874 [Loa loa]|uniref:pyridoxal 5'-phosphate synthase n=1 Tax=Loa loa TaxID=7209 RepID=A0A1S0UDT2_LOALO|nr:hypothetical protein LOAG_18874 [Loa loa]EJD73713.1 hypothetical protein LOAG_18874 [Loa loa]